MKIRIKNYNGELPDYLTVGKVCEVVDKLTEFIVCCVGDNGLRFDAYIGGASLRLNGGSWEVVE